MRSAMKEFPRQEIPTEKVLEDFPVRCEIKVRMYKIWTYSLASSITDPPTQGDANGHVSSHYSWLWYKKFTNKVLKYWC